MSKGVHKNLAVCKRLCKLQELYTAFKKKTKKKPPKYKYWDLKVLCLETQIVCSGWLQNDSICLCFKRSSKCCVASRCNGLRLDIQRPDQEDCLQPWEQQMPHASVWIPSWQCNSEEFLDQNSTNMKIMRN